MDKHFLENKVNCTLTVKIQVFPSSKCIGTLVAQSVLQHCLDGGASFFPLEISETSERPVRAKCLSHCYEKKKI